MEPVWRLSVPSHLGKRSRVTMATAFLGKTMRCVNVAPVRGEGLPNGRRVESRLCAWFSYVVNLFWVFLLCLNYLFGNKCLVINSFDHFNFFRRGKGFFRHRLATLQQWEGSSDPLGQKYRFRETDLRLNREKGNSTPSPFLPISNPGALIPP